MLSIRFPRVRAGTAEAIKPVIPPAQLQLNVLNVNGGEETPAGLRSPAAQISRRAPSPQGRARLTMCSLSLSLTLSRARARSLSLCCSRPFCHGQGRVNFFIAQAEAACTTFASSAELQTPPDVPPQGVSFIGKPLLCIRICTVTGAMVCTVVSWCAWANHTACPSPLKQCFAANYSRSCVRRRSHIPRCMTMVRCLVARLRVLLARYITRAPTRRVDRTQACRSYRPFSYL